MVRVEDGSPTEGARGRQVRVRGEVIERERLRRMWSIKDLARIAEVSERTLNGIAPQGRTALKLATFEKIIRAFADHPASDLADEALAEDDQ